MQSGSGQLIHFIIGFLATALTAAQPVWADDRLALQSHSVWELRKAWFGGFSGIEITEHGRKMTVISDRGTYVTARLGRTKGKLSSVQVLSITSLQHPNGKPNPKSFNDVEGLAIDAQGRVFLSFEGRDRVMGFNPKTRETTRLGAHPDFAEFSINKGLEALAVHPDGRLFAIAERIDRATASTPIYQRANGVWRISHRVSASGPFLPVGADFDDQGQLYLLERALTPLGFRTRIRRFDLDRAPLAGETLLSTTPGLFDNLEGISVWQDAAGATRLTLISDDNFLPVQRTQIVEFIVKE